MTSPDFLAKSDLLTNVGLGRRASVSSGISASRPVQLLCSAMHRVQYSCIVVIDRCYNKYCGERSLYEHAVQHGVIFTGSVQNPDRRNPD